jgi:SP family sugar:H+ symporter-like MFS transporter
LTPFANSGISYNFGFVFCGCNIAAAVITYFFLFETKSLSLEQVDVMYSQKNITAMKSSKWVPEGYLSRNDRDESYWQRRKSILDDAKYAPGGTNAMERGEKSIDEKGDESSVKRSENIVDG